MNKKLTCVDLFCGCGGFSLGFQQAGFEIICGIDLDKWALKTYQHNIGNAVKADVWHLPLRPNIKPDCVIGGPPCPAFSKVTPPKAKRGERLRKQALLLVAFALAVRYLNPKTVCAENVPQAAKSWQWHYMTDLLSGKAVEGALEPLSYGVPLEELEWPEVRT